MTEIIKIDSVIKYFKENKAINDLSLQLKENKIYGLLGRKSLANPEILCIYLHF